MLPALIWCAPAIMMTYAANSMHHNSTAVLGGVDEKVLDAG